MSFDCEIMGDFHDMMREVMEYEAAQCSEVEEVAVCVYDVNGQEL